MTRRASTGVLGVLSLFVVLSITLQQVPCYGETDLVIDILKPGTRKGRIAIPDFTWRPPGREVQTGRLIAKIVGDDLRFSGIFEVVERADYPPGEGVSDSDPAEVDFDAWAAAGVDAVATGQYYYRRGKMGMECRLFDIELGQQIVGKRYVGEKDMLRQMAHVFADEIVYRFTGARGVAHSSIAFVSTREGKKEVYVMDYDGKNVRRVTNDNSITLSPAWSPDGTKIAYTSFKDGNPNVYVMSTEDGTVEEIAAYPGLNNTPSWSPDGKDIALALTKDGNAEIYLFEVSTGRLRRLTHNRAIDCSPSWSPNSREIAFVSNRSGNPQLYVMDREGTNLRRLTYQGSYNASPAWSPGGDKIAFVSMSSNVFDIYVMNADGTNVEGLTADAASNESPSWSPDGRHIVFSSTQDGRPNIFVMNSDGTTQRRLTFLGGDNVSPAWSP